MRKHSPEEELEFKKAVLNFLDTWENGIGTSAFKIENLLDFFYSQQYSFTQVIIILYIPSKYVSL